MATIPFTRGVPSADMLPIDDLRAEDLLEKGDDFGGAFDDEGRRDGVVTNGAKIRHGVFLSSGCSAAAGLRRGYGPPTVREGTQLTPLGDSCLSGM